MTSSGPQHRASRRETSLTAPARDTATRRVRPGSKPPSRAVNGPLGGSPGCWTDLVAAQPPEEIPGFFGSWPDGAVVNPLIRM